MSTSGLIRRRAHRRILHGSDTNDSHRSRRGGTFVVAVAGVLALTLVTMSCSSDGTTDGDGSATGQGATETTVASSDTGPDDGRSVDGPAQETATLARYADHTSDVYEDPAAWLCRPDADDICSADQDTTFIESGGTTFIEPWSADPDAPIDCF